jgi:glyoxylase-like metal-dependent hydrolase (beta-lactamase superfamily II)
MTATFHRIDSNLCVIERGWLNCNQVVLTSPERNVLIDSGYGRHAQRTIGYVEEALGAGTLHQLLNTHCHSDHMGGNRALAAHFGCEVIIPEGEVKHVVPWTEQSCWSEQMDQYAEEFAIDATLAAGDIVHAGARDWRAVAAPGHDMDAVMFFSEEGRILVSGDALWERGMGFVWPEREGESRTSFLDHARATLDVIEQLNPSMVIPGHGAPFGDVAAALAESRARLDAFQRDPAKHARHVVRALFVFSLLDRGNMRADAVADYIRGVPVYAQMREDFLGGKNEELAQALVNDLVRAGAINVVEKVLFPTMRA